MATRPLGVTNDEDSLHAQLSSLDSGEKPLGQKLRDAHEILRRYSNASSKFHGDSPSLKVPQSVSKAVLRWLLKHAETVGSWNINRQSLSEYWFLVGTLIADLPTNTLANLLRHVDILQCIDKASDCYLHGDDFHGTPSHTSSETLVGNEESAGSTSSTASSSAKKRKLERNAPTTAEKRLKIAGSTAQVLGSCDPSPPQIFSVLRQLSNKIQGPVESLPRFDEEILRQALSTDTNVLASLLAQALQLASSFQDEQSQVKDLESNKSIIEDLLKPTVFLWNSQSGDVEDPDSNRSICFSTTCLKWSLIVFSKLNSRSQSTKTMLERLVLRDVLRPAWKRYLSLKSPGVELHDLSFLEEGLGVLSRNYREVSGSQFLSDCPSRALPEPEAVLFHIALRSWVSEAETKTQVAESWMRVLFRYLCGIEAESPSEEDIDHSVRRRKLWSDLLSAAKQYNCSYDRPTLENIMRRVHNDGQIPLSISDWEIIGSCITLDTNIIIPRSQTNNSDDLAQNLMTRTSKLTLTRPVIATVIEPKSVTGLSTIHDGSPAYASLENFVLPLLRSCVRTRRFDHFISHWLRELSLARMHINKHNFPEDTHVLSLISVWEHPKLLSTVSASLIWQPQKPSQLLAFVLESLETEFSKAQVAEQVHSHATVILAIICSINSEEDIFQVTGMARKTKDLVQRCIRHDDAPSLQELLWLVQSRLCERWPEIFGEHESRENTMKLVKHARNTLTKAISIISGDMETDRIRFSAVGFLWRLLSNTRGSTNYSVLEQSAKLSKIIKHFLPVLESQEEPSSSKSDDGAAGQRLVMEYVRLLIESPDPLLLLDASVRSKLINSVIHSILSRMAACAAASEASPGSVNKEELAQLASWLRLQPFRNNELLHMETRRIILQEANNLAQTFQGKNGFEKLSRILRVLRSQDVDDWGKKQRSLVAHLLLQWIDACNDTTCHWLLIDIIYVLAHFLRRPLSDSNISETKLRNMLCEDTRLLSLSNSAFEAMPALKTYTGGLRTEFQALLGEVSKEKKDPSAQLDIGLSNETKQYEASRRYAEFAQSVNLASSGEKEKLVRALAIRVQGDTSLPLMIFARKLCSARYDTADRTKELREGLQGLLYQLLCVAAESMNIKRVILALRAITAALSKNAWAIGQLQIDQSLACVSILPARHGLWQAEEPSMTRERPPTSNRSRLDVASARRMVFGSLAVRTPRTEAEGQRVRQQLAGQRSSDGSAVPPPLSAAPPPPPSSNPPEPALAAALYAALCALGAATLLHHRARTGGRWHLVVGMLRALLRPLFTPHTPPRESPWIAAEALDAAHAVGYTRLLTLVCDPSAAAAQALVGSRQRARTEKAAPLHDDARRARQAAGQHVLGVLHEWCGLRLQGRMTAPLRAALMPGLYAACTAMGSTGARVLSEGLGPAEREVWRELWAEYGRFGRWQGG